jgi:hypothetical protein
MEKGVALVEQFGAAHSVPTNQAINELNLCLDEILNNTISYGYDDSDYADPKQEVVRQCSQGGKYQ